MEVNENTGSGGWQEPPWQEATAALAEDPEKAVPWSGTWESALWATPEALHTANLQNLIWGQETGS